MSNAVEIHYLFADPLDNAVKEELYEALLEHPEIESSVTPAEASERLERGEEVGINARFRSLYPTINLSRTPSGLPDYPNLLVYLEGQTFSERLHDAETVAEHAEDTIELATLIYEEWTAVGWKPEYVFASDPTQTEQLRTDHDAIRTTTAGVEEGRLEELYWLQILPPAMVADVGANTLTDAPAYHVERLPDDSMLLVAHQNPKDVGEDYLALLEQLGLELDDLS